MSEETNKDLSREEFLYKCIKSMQKGLLIVVEDIFERKEMGKGLYNLGVVVGYTWNIIKPEDEKEFFEDE